jgi:hypothetical protein
MKPKLDTVTLSALLLLLVVQLCPQPLSAQAESGVQQSPEITLDPQFGATSNTTETDVAASPTIKPLQDNLTSQNMIVLIIVVGAFIAYGAVIAVLASRKIK